MRNWRKGSLAVWTAIVAGAVLVTVSVGSTPGQAQACDNPDWTALSDEPRPLCTLLLIEDPAMALTDCASTIQVAGTGASLEFVVEGIGATRYRLLEQEAEPELSAATTLIRSIVDCYADDGCMTDIDGAIAAVIEAVPDDPSSSIVGMAEASLRETVQTEGGGFFGDIDRIVPPSAHLSIVAVGSSHLLVLRTTLSPFDQDAAGPVSVTPLDPNTRTSICRE